MTTESLPEHLRKPHIRPIRAMPVEQDGRQVVALCDPSNLSGQTMAVAPPVMKVIQLFRGERTIEELAKAVQTEVNQMLQLVEGLDRLGLLWGPTFKQLEQMAQQRLRESGVYPARATRSLGQDEKECRARIEGWLNDSEDPEVDGQPRALVCPHLDYERGWPNYASAYHCLTGMQRPDRVVVLGTNHFGIGDGVVLTEYSFQTPLGTCPIDTDVTSKLSDRARTQLRADELDHLGEFSIEVQLPWLQYFFGGDVPIVPAIVPDPLLGLIEEDDERMPGEAFAAALSSALDEVGGTTLVVSSADLSHVGPQFGEPRPVDDQRRFDVEKHDREMIDKFLNGDADEFISAFKWNRNPTRWCSIGNMAATLRLVEPETVEMLDYRQAYDDNGQAMVSSAAFALL